MVKVIIRQTSDLDTIAEMDREYFADYARLTDKELATSNWWLATMDGEPVGFAGITLMPDQHKAFMTRVAVAPIARGGGLQKRLIRVRTTFAKRNGITRCYTYVWAGNFPSMRSLISCGFRPYYLTRYDNITYTYLETEPAVLPSY
jgi:GNAT superfamily N-acetyltransferase